MPGLLTIACDNMKKRTGYEVTVELHGEHTRTFCVDDKGSIRGMYIGFRDYLSDWELWSEQESGGLMGGELKPGEKVSVSNMGDRSSEYLGYRIVFLKVIRVKEVDMDEMTRDPYISGVDRPILKGGYPVVSLN